MLYGRSLFFILTTCNSLRLLTPNVAVVFKHLFRQNQIPTRPMSPLLLESHFRSASNSHSSVIRKNPTQANILMTHPELLTQFPHSLERYQALPKASRAPHDLRLTTSLSSSPNTLNLTHSASATQASLLFQHRPASGPLHWLFLPACTTGTPSINMAGSLLQAFA